MDFTFSPLFTKKRKLPTFVSVYPPEPCNFFLQYFLNPGIILEICNTLVVLCTELLINSYIHWKRINDFSLTDSIENSSSGSEEKFKRNRISKEK